MPSAAQTFDDDGLTPVGGIDPAGRAPREPADDGTPRRAFEIGTVVIGKPQQRAHTRAEQRRAKRLLIELLLIAGERPAFGQIAGVGRARGPVENGRVIRTAIGTGGKKHERQQGRKDFHRHV